MQLEFRWYLWGLSWVFYEGGMMKTVSVLLIALLVVGCTSSGERPHTSSYHFEQMVLAKTYAPSQSRVECENPVRVKDGYITACDIRGLTKKGATFEITRTFSWKDDGTFNVMEVR